MRALVVAFVLLAACTETPSDPPPPESTPEAPPAPSAQAEAPDAEPLAQANAAADLLASTLRARLLAAMGEGGPPAAARVCADEAPALAARVSEETGARVGRSSLRLRSDRNAAPAWVAAWLAEQGERSADGVSGFARIEEGHARVVRPIAIEGPCLTCHGDPATLAPEVSALLHERYPDDRATGYALGDLRGALWVELDVTR